MAWQIIGLVFICGLVLFYSCCVWVVIEHNIEEWRKRKEVKQ